MAEFRTIFKPQRITKKSARWEKAYIAGLVDAKGSLAIYPRHNKGSVKQQLMTVISLCSHDIGELRMVQERYGGIIKLAGRNKEKNATIYRLLIQSKRDIVFLMRYQEIPYSKEQASPSIMEILPVQAGSAGACGEPPPSSNHRRGELLLES